VCVVLRVRGIVSCVFDFLFKACGECDEVGLSGGKVWMDQQVLRQISISDCFLVAIVIHYQVIVCFNSVFLGSIL